LNNFLIHKLKRSGRLGKMLSFFAGMAGYKEIHFSAWQRAFQPHADEVLRRGFELIEALSRNLAVQADSGYLVVPHYGGGQATAADTTSASVTDTGLAFSTPEMR
jgi:hypothetical protein